MSPTDVRFRSLARCCPLPLYALVSRRGASAILREPRAATTAMVMPKTTTGTRTSHSRTPVPAQKSKRRPSVAFLVPCPYRRGHDYPSVRCRFPALVPGAQPRFVGARACCSATPGDRPASATPRPASALLHRPVALGVALPNLAAGPQHHGGGQTGQPSSSGIVKASASTGGADHSIWGGQR